MSRAQHTAFQKARGLSIKLAVGCVAATTLAGCEVAHDRGVKVGQMLVTDAKANHPIIVSKKMVKLNIPVRRGDYGLSAEKKMELGHFVDRYRREGEGRLIVSAPVGQPNEVAAFNVLDEVRQVMQAHGIVRSAVKLSPYRQDGDPEAPIVISYLGYSAEGPNCGPLQKDMTGDDRNLPYEQMACANQANFAAMVANPRDLVEPRGETPRIGERRDQMWDKYVKGDSTETKKSSDQKTTLSSSIGN